MHFTSMYWSLFVSSMQVASVGLPSDHYCTFQYLSNNKLFNMMYFKFLFHNHYLYLVNDVFKLPSNLKCKRPHIVINVHNI